MKTRFLAISVALGITSLARADFTPIAINPASFNKDPVIESTAPRTMSDACTATMDGGTNKTGNTWYEVGYITNSTTGLPLHNSLVSSNNHTYIMPPDYHTNNVILIGHGNGGGTPVQSFGTLTLATPAPYTTLSFLNSAGNGPVIVGYIVHYSDSSTESNVFTSLDWFNGAVRIYNASGRVSTGGNVANVGGVPAGALFGADVPLANTTANVTSIDFRFAGGNGNGNTNNNGRTMIFAVSGSTDNGVTFSPLTVSGFTFDGVIEADGPKTTGTGNADPITGATPWGVLTNDNTYCNFTMDGGTSKQQFTWFEQGYYAAYPNAGIPAAGSTITSATEPTIHYTMPSTYAGNCAVCLASNIPTANVRFQTPTAAGGLSLLLGDGNGAVNLRTEVQFQDGTVETNWITPIDWFDRTDPWAWVSFGQVRPGLRNLAATPDQFGNAYFNIGFGPFLRDPRLNSGGLNPNVPNIRLFDVLLPVINSSGLITNVALITTNVPNFTTTIAIFAVSGSPGCAPSITQPVSLNTDPASGVTNLTVGAAVANDIRLIKGFQGTHFSLWVSNRLNGVPVSYQWKKAPRGASGWRDISDSFDMSTFANVSGPNIGGATSNFLTISNANISDSGDYLVVASNPYGSMTSFVASVMVMTTNGSVLVGAGNGDVITKYTGDTDSGTPNEVFQAASDQQQQKWLSQGLLVGQLPFAGPAGYVVTPVSGASFVNTIRFYCANDAQQRDPRDYSLEGSNDGTSWTTITGGQLLGTLMLPVARGGTGTTPLNPMTQPLMEVDFANPNSYKSYRVTITNNMEPNVNTLMQIAEIQLLGTFVPAPPTWVRQPEPAVTAYVGTSPSFAAKASGLGALAPKYLWFRGSSAIAGATTSSYTISNAQLADSGSTFFCVATNNFGSITSSVGTLTVIAAPAQSYPAAVLANNPKAYWRLDEPDNGVGNSGVVAHDYAGGHNGYYSNTVNGVSGYNPASDPDTATQVGTGPDQLVAGINDVDFTRPNNTAGATFSVEAWVLGNNQLGTNAIVAKGYNGALSAGTGTGTEQYALDVAGGNPFKFRFLVRDALGNGYTAQSSVTPYDAISFQPTWRHVVGVCDQPNGKIYIYVDGLLAATNSIPANAGIINIPLPTTIGSRQASASSDYNNQWVGTIDDVAVYGTALSAGQVLAHFYAAQRPPIISLQPTNQTTPENVIVTFYTSSYGPGTLSYQWYLSDSINPTAPVVGQTSPNLSFNTSVSQSGNNYQLVVTNQYGAVTSAVAQLTVVGGAPSFATDLPSSQTVYLGHVMQLRVDALGTAPFTYQWKKDGVNISDNYRISGSHTNVLTIGYATNSDSGTYQVFVSNGQGTTPSSADAVTVTNVTSLFNATAAGWSIQGSTPPIMTANSVELTSGLGNTARSAFLSDRRFIGTFALSFVYQDLSGAGAADGITFCIQNAAAGAAAVGAGGGGLAYSGIGTSVALAMNIYDPNTRGIYFAQNGVLNPAGAGAYAPITPILVGGNTNQIQVNINYSGTVLTATFKDLVTSSTVTTNFTVNIPSIVTDSSAFIGFTGADGGVVSTQVVSSFVLAAPPVRLTAQHVGDSLVLTWPSTVGAFLKSTPTLTSPVWTDVTAPFQVVGSQSQVTVSPLSSGSNQYYRLWVYP